MSMKCCINNYKTNIEVSPSKNRKEYRRQYYLKYQQGQDTKERSRERIFCECGKSYFKYNEKYHMEHNKFHSFFVQNKHNPDFVEEYFKVINLDIEKTLKSYYLKKLKKKYNFEGYYYSSSNSSNEEEVESVSSDGIN